MTLFREGDVVHVTGYDDVRGFEGRIDRPHPPNEHDPDGSGWWVQFPDGSSLGERWYKSEDIHILRRPLRVGDEVTIPGQPFVRVVSHIDLNGKPLANQSGRNYELPPTIVRFDEVPLDLPHRPTLVINPPEASLPPVPKPRPVKRCANCNDVLKDRPARCSGCAGPEVAWSLFKTDPEVVAFVESISDHYCYEGPDAHDVDFERLAAAWDKVWTRNERGWRTKHEERARDMLRVIREDDGPPDGGDRPPHPLPKE